VGQTIFHGLFFDILHIQSNDIILHNIIHIHIHIISHILFTFKFECGEYRRIICEILLVPHDTVMDLNDAMYIIGLHA